LATSVSDVFDLFMTRVNDYQLTAIYNTSASTLNLHLEPYILDSIQEFDICDQSLDYTLTSGSVEGYFTENLNSRNKYMLSRIMVKFWWAYQVRNLLQFSNLLQDHDFKTFSQAQNLQAKQESYNIEREEVSQLLQDYAYKNNDWANWKIQNFDGS
jgi:hypothetical protein